MAAIFAFYSIFLCICSYKFNGDCLVNVLDSVNSCGCQFCRKSRHFWLTSVSLDMAQFLNSLFSNPVESERVGIKFSMPLIWLVEEHDTTMQPHFDRCVCQMLNFPVFDETDKCQFHIFRFLVKNNFVAVTSTFINNYTSSVSGKEKKSPVWMYLILYSGVLLAFWLLTITIL